MDFSQVAAEFQRLKAQFEAGALSEAEFKARLEELMLQDEQGRWWMIGYETGQWYYHDGQQWVRSEPPVAEPRPAPPEQPAAHPVTREEPPAPPARPARKTWPWVVVGLVGLALVAVLVIKVVLPTLGLRFGPALWADRTVLVQGECTTLRWNAPNLGKVRLQGPGFDAGLLVGSIGAVTVCPAPPGSVYELKDPDWHVIERVEIQVREEWRE